MWLLSLSIIFSRLTHVLSVLHSFLWPNHIPLQGHTTFCLFVHQFLYGLNVFISPMYIPMSRIAELCNSVYLFEQLPNFQNLGFCDVPVALGKTAQWVFCVPETAQILPVKNQSCRPSPHCCIRWTPISYIPVARAYLTLANNTVTWELSETKSLISRSVQSKSSYWSYTLIVHKLMSPLSPLLFPKGEK